MSSDLAVSFAGVTKHYLIGGGALSSYFKRAGKDFLALDNVSFAVEKGKTLGIIGPNGSGKSTVLRLLAGVTSPDAGEVMVNGRIAPMIELGAGFHPELTGRENVYLNAALFGLSRPEIECRFSDIVSFAGLEEFIDTPVKKYSSGMFVRLGFALCVHMDPDVLLVDEVLAVGDENFQRKCINKFKEFRQAGKTIVFVSHDLGLISAICDQAVFLYRGKVVEYGANQNVISHYLQTMMGDVEGIAVVTAGLLTLTFSNGKAALFWNGIEITKKMGLYTSIFSSARDDSGFLWHDSTRATWRCEQIDEKRIRCVGEYLSLPISQEWLLILENENTIRWQTSLCVHSDIWVERYYVNIMLSEQYLSWTAGDQTGTFPEEFTSRDYYNWDVVCASNGNSVKVNGIDAYPTVALERQDCHQLSSILNSSFFFSGRVLTSMQLFDSNKINSGDTLHFNGIIKINGEYYNE